MSCFFVAGTELLSIADTQHWVAEIAVESAEAERLAVGLPAEVIWDAAPQTRLTGKVQSIAEETFEPTIDSIRRDHPEAVRNRWTPQTRYLVSIAIDSPPENITKKKQSADRRAITWLVGGDGRVKIETASQSVWSRVAEMFAGVFRFR
jgi:putative peptide zinc metalloprotease protein